MVEEKAEEIFVLLNQNYRISRNHRLKWYLDHLLKPVPNVCQNLNDVKNNDELHVLSIAGDSGNNKNNSNLLVGTETKVTFISNAYKFVFGLDLSSSMLRVDTLQQFVVIEAIITNLEKCLTSLTQSFSIHGSVEIKPDIYVTVFAQWFGTQDDQKDSFRYDRMLQKVLLQGCQLTESSVGEIVRNVKDCIYSCMCMNDSFQMKSNMQKHDDIVLGILRTGLLALRILPSIHQSSMIIITDGVLGEPNFTSLERIIKQCQNTTTSCFFIHVCFSANPLCDFGCISNIDLMEFIAKSTKGHYINTLHLLSSAPGINFFQTVLFPWTFQISQPISFDMNTFQKCVSHRSCTAFDFRNAFPIAADAPILIRRKQHERNVKSDILTVVSARLREGYQIKSTKIAKGTIEICLELPWWKNYTLVEYKVSSVWPLTSNSCKVEVFICGTYEFLLDVSKSKESRQWTRSRKLVMHRFLLFFQDLLHSDHMLQYLQTFFDDPLKYTISDSLRQGQTLYYLPPNSTQFELSTQTQHTTSAFVSYWKPILSLDGNVWHQWFHIHKIEAILQHDIPLPENLFNLSISGRYHSVQSRYAFGSVVSMLRKWCTFVLLENHTYVKFVYDDDDNSAKPISFFLVRLLCKSSAMVLKLAFLIGLSGKTRKLHLEQLREKVSELVYSVPSLSPSSSGNRIRHPSSKQSPMGKMSRAQHSTSDLPCAMLIHKPLDQLLVRYSQSPDNYMSNALANHPKGRQSSGINDQYIRMRDMQWYLHHRRCVWSVANTTSTQMPMDVACYLAKLMQKIRMEEGFHIAYSSSGIVNLTREFPMKSENEKPDVQDYCLVQYIIFPPKVQATESINSEGSVESENEEADEDVAMSKEILFATELWIEPQHGLVMDHDKFFGSQVPFDTSNHVSHYGNLKSGDFLNHIIDRDFACISNIVTLEHMHLMCTDKEDFSLKSVFPQPRVPFNFPPFVELTNVSSSPSHSFNEANANHTNGTSSNLSEQSIRDHSVNYYSCVFDIVHLLENSQRIKHLFMTLAENESNNKTANSKLLENFHKALASFSDSTVSLSQKDQNAISKYIFQGKKCLNSPQFSEFDDDWSCYLKRGQSGQVFVILLPTSFESFLKLLDAYEEDHGDKQENFKRGPSDSTNLESSNTAVHTALEEFPIFSSEDKENSLSARVPRRLSIKRLASTNSEAFEQPLDSNVTRRTFFLYVYNCSMKMLESSLLHGAKNSMRIKWPDSLQDHRVYVDSENEDYLQQLSHRSDSYVPKSPSNSNRFNDISDSAFPLHSTENDYLSFINHEIDSMYQKSFVVGTFWAVQSEGSMFFSKDDLQIATDYICKESVDEIDITDFMFLNCPQIIEFKSQSLQQSLPSEVDTYDLSSSDDSNIKEACADNIEQKKVADVNMKDTDANDVMDFSTASGDQLDLSVEENAVIDKGTTHLMASNLVGSNVLLGKSAFTSVQRCNTSAAVQTDDSAVTTTSDDERCQLIDNPSFSRGYEKKTLTIPIKHVIKSDQRYSGLQTGWNNLTEFPIAILDVAHSRHLSGSSEQIEKHFLHLLKSYCQAVPGVPFLFYAVNGSAYPKTELKKNETHHQNDNDLEVQFLCFDENTMKHSISVDTSNEINVLPLEPEAKISMYRNDDVHSLSGSDTSETVDDIIPLFLYMTCTVRDLQTGNRGSVPVKCLPLSLKDVLESFDLPCKTIDLSKIKITLDLIWIYLPSETNIAAVPDECNAFVQAITEKIKWLLEDEIISSLRTTEPINITTLERVARHVQSYKTTNSKVETAELHLIFGADKSKPLLHAEFEKFPISKHKLKKVGQYYFLSLESFLPISYSLPSSTSLDDDNEAILPGDYPLSILSPKSSVVKAMGNSQSSISFKAKALFNYNQSSCASLHGVGTRANEEEKPEKRIKKASSSNELVTGSGGIVRRCTSASNMPIHSSCKKEPNLTSLSQINVDSPDVISFPPGLFHQTLRPTLSLGKETKPYSPVNNFKSQVASMPATPSNVANTNSEVFTFFPLNKKDSTQTANIGDFGASPISELSTRQFSQTSWLGSGYEGEESDSGEELEFRNSLQEAASQLPNFWLMVKFDDECATVYFHRRSSTRALPWVKKEHSRIFGVIQDNLKRACKAVNQTLLLNMLHDSRWCHPLLVEESPDDIWKKNDYSSLTQHFDADDQTSDEFYRYGNDYLAATMAFAPGEFECRCVLQQTVILHHRIAVSKSSGGGTVPSALSTVRSFMKNFAVVNRKNMFVFQVQDGAVFYCKMHEERKRPESGGRRSSTLHFEAEQTKEAIPKVQVADSRLHLKWYGVHCPLSQHNIDELNELKIGVEKKLDDTVLEYITLMLCRNSQFKLTPADVNLIQLREVDSCGRQVPIEPDNTVSIDLPSQLSTGNSMSSVLYYIHQHLLQFLAIPRYSDPGLSQFLPVLTKTPEKASIDSPAMYLYTELTEKGKMGHGIACICLDFVSKKCAQQKTNVEEILTLEALKVSTEIKLCCPLVTSETESSILVYIWTRGSLNTDILHRKIKTAVEYALCDAVTERCLEIPFAPQCHIKTDAMKPLFNADNSKETTVPSFYQSFFQSKLSGDSSRSHKAPVANAKSSESDGKGGLTPGAGLHNFYGNVIRHWLGHMVNISSPSVFHNTIKCRGKLNIDQVVTNVCKILTALVADSDVLKFCRILGSDDEWVYTDADSTASPKPGQYMEYTVISRNFNLWKKITKSSSSLFKPSASTISLQKFPPHDINLKPDASPCPQHDMMMSSSFIARQHFVYVVASNGCVEVFTYNIVIDKVQSLMQRLKKCSQFHQARLNMLQGLTYQKLGLFKHFLVNQSSSKDAPLSPYTVHTLTRFSKMPPSQEKHQKKLIDKCFDEVLLNVPLMYGGSPAALQTKDKTAHYGQQCVAIFKQKKLRKDQQMQLKTLWRRTSGSSHSMNSQEMETVLSHARLLTTVTSPIVLDKTNRRKFVSLFEKPKVGKSDRADSAKHSTSILRTSSFLGSYRRRSGESLSKMSEKDNQSALQGEPLPDFFQSSYDFISSLFSKLYAEHWKCFVELDIVDLKRTEEKTDCSTDLKDSRLHYRYRSSRGGIILIVFFVDHNCFQVKLYSVSASLFSDQTSRSRLKTYSNFTSECEKIKQNLNVHRIALDVHLRYLRWYLMNNYSTSTHKFNLYDLMQSIATCYEALLDNIQSQIYQGTIVASCTQVNALELHSFIVENANAFKLQTCCALKDNCEMNEKILFTDERAKQHIDTCSSTSHDSRDVFLVIFKDDESDAKVLKLHYFLLFSQNRHSLDAITGSSKRLPDAFVQAGANISRKLSVPSPLVGTLQADIAASRSEFTSESEDPVPPYVLCEKTSVETTLRELAYTATTECYRSCYLWKKLSSMCQEKNFGKGLSYSEFCTLLEMMQVTSASEYDPRLSKLFKCRNSIKQDQFVQKRLLKKFPKSSTQIASSDGTVQHVCVLTPNDVHAMVMITSNTISQVLDVRVARPLPEHSIFHRDCGESASKELLSKVASALCTSVWMSWF